VACALLAVSKTILEGVDRAFKKVPGNCGHSNCSSNKQAELQQSRQKKKVDVCPVEQNRKKKIYERMVDINSVTYLACVHQRLELENFGSDAGNPNEARWITQTNISAQSTGSMNHEFTVTSLTRL
jgi:hypothetical protein